MKFVIYNGQNKFIINNVSIPDIQKIVPSMTQDDFSDDTVQSFNLYNFRITSTRGAMIEEDEYELPNEELAREIEEGIHWAQETIH